MVRGVVMIYNLISFFGCYFVLLAYYLYYCSSVDKTKVHWLNLTGAILLFIFSIHTGLVPYMFLNGMWSIITIIELLKQLKE